MSEQGEEHKARRGSDPRVYRSSMTEMDHYKFVVIGPQGTGKSSVIQNLLGNPFNPDIKQTNCYEVHIKSFDVDGRNLEVRLWDCSFYHNQSYSTVKKAFYRGAVCAIIVVDVGRHTLIEDYVGVWVTEFLENEVQQAIVIANKHDQMPEFPFKSQATQAIQLQEGQLSQQHDMQLQNIVQRLNDQGLKVFVGSCKEDSGAFRRMFMDLLACNHSQDILEVSKNVLTSRFDSERNQMLMTTYRAKQQTEPLITVPNPEPKKSKCSIF